MSTLSPIIDCWPCYILVSQISFSCNWKRSLHFFLTSLFLFFSPSHSQATTSSHYFHDSVFFFFLDFTYQWWLVSIRLSLPDLFHLAYCLPGLSILLQMAEFPFVRLKKILICFVCTTFFLPICHQWKH